MRFHTVGKNSGLRQADWVFGGPKVMGSRIMCTIDGDFYGAFGNCTKASIQADLCTFKMLNFNIFLLKNL